LQSKHCKNLQRKNSLVCYSTNTPHTAQCAVVGLNELVVRLCNGVNLCSFFSSP
jgi:hypothetical protein